ncbi:hypothetical protein SLEP1_g17393 [Rubroshorea leprosula]|uniref:Uncharacterized protein n=1 Tax=Rubroshorea leprosula TaxID=152421 RepID=A0AAV5IZM9_9ROSI|nr:hypothetical protein SLEP1_g17393 [Rubroshorea leprosula]
MPSQKGTTIMEMTGFCMLKGSSGFNGIISWAEQLGSYPMLVG